MKKVTLLFVFSLLVLFLVSFLLSIFTFAYADTNSFQFVTQPQTILPNVVSSAITIESQNTTGTVEAVGETIGISFHSTSLTGKFVTSTGTEAGHVMSKGTAKKTFYYIDPTLGVYLLTVTLIGRTTHQTFAVTQPITVSAVLLQPAPVIASTSGVKTPVKVTKSKSTKVSAKNLASSTDIMSWPTAADTQSQATSSMATVYQAKVQTPIFDSLLDWPSEFWQWLKKLF